MSTPYTIKAKNVPAPEPSEVGVSFFRLPNNTFFRLINSRPGDQTYLKIDEQTCMCFLGDVTIMAPHIVHNNPQCIPASKAELNFEFPKSL